MAAKLKKARNKVAKKKVQKKKAATKGKTKAFGKVKGGTLVPVPETHGGVGDGTPSKALQRAYDGLRSVLRKERVNLVGVLVDVQGKVAVVSTGREPDTLPDIVKFAKVLTPIAAAVESRLDAAAAEAKPVPAAPAPTASMPPDAPAAPAATATEPTAADASSAPDATPIAA